MPMCARRRWTKTPGFLAIRADAAPELGTGHVMRCLALAQAWRRKRGTAAFYAAWMPDGLRARIEKEGFPVRPVHAGATVQAPGADADDGAPDDPATRDEAEAFARQADEHGAVWVALDGYRFDAAYQDAVVTAGLRLITIDDHGRAGRYPADLVVDQNLGAEPAHYDDTGPDTRVLLGPRYILLREEFRAARKRRTGPTANDADATGVLVTLGGAPPPDLLRTVLEGVDAAGHAAGAPLGPATVLAGTVPAGDRARLTAGLRAAPRFLGPAADVAEAMVAAILAVSAGGTTAWELAHLGVPTLLLARADNQVRVCRALAAHGAAYDLGPADGLSATTLADACTGLLEDPATRAKMAEAGRRLVDGHGTGRVLFWMKRALLDVRPATTDDSRTVWAWANDPETRAVSYTSDPIPWDAHRDWFQGRLDDRSMRLVIAELEPRTAGTEDPLPVAFLRIEPGPAHGPGAHVVSINVAPEHRALGIGPAAIHLGCEAAMTAPDVERILALIKPDNPRSRAAFERAGFRETGRTTLRGAPACIYSYEGLGEDVQ